MNPILSIIIPCYNSSRYITEMLACIQKQSLVNWELLLVDDGSNDDTLHIAKRYADVDGRVKIFKQCREPKGSVTCRNIGFDNSIGKYIIHFDSDDLISPTCFEKRVEFMERNPDIDYASFPAKSFVDSQKLPSFSDENKTWGCGNDGEDMLMRFLKADYPFSVWCNIYRRDSIKNFRWDENVKIYTDFSFIIPMILAGLKHRYANINQVDYFYRNSESGQNMCSNFVSSEKCESTIYLIQKTLESIKENPNYQKYKKCFFSFILLHFFRLAEKKNDIDISNYCAFLKKYYNWYTVNILKMTYILSKYIKYYKLSHYVLKLFIYIFLPSGKHVRLLLKQLFKFCFFLPIQYLKKIRRHINSGYYGMRLKK